jgi:hypothetical protein
MKPKTIIGIIGGILLLIGFFAFGLPSIIAQLLGLPQMFVYAAPIVMVVIGAAMFWYGFFKKGKKKE